MEEKIETNRDVVGQVILKKSAQPLQLKNYCFTWNNYGDFPYARTQLCDALMQIVKIMVFQAEIGANGTMHIQGVIVLKKRMRWSEFNLPKSIHWEACRDLPASLNYCQKIETRDPMYSPFVYGLPDHTWKSTILTATLKEWQQGIIDIYNTPPDDRKIYWYYDELGGNGKTFIAKYMALKYPDVQVSTCTRSADILTCANENIKMYILNFPRSVADFAPYNAIEQLKDGLICDAKLKKETRTLVVAPAHIIIFANFEPKYEALSADRWIIKKF